ncbi:MAG: conjugal transfer protein TraA [Myxococcaceae bacterium]|nr:conjugal transfer protein TraA [Myxococcaceae bacterium]
MALYRFAVSVISRRAGQSAVACAAYRSGETLRCERNGKSFAFAEPERVKHREILAPVGAPAWVFERERLWNSVERSEKRADSQLAREVQLALPLELSEEAQLELARTFIQDEFVSRGMVADFAIHRGEADDPQPHVHVMLTMRDLGPDGFTRKNRHWNSKKLLRHWRQAWEHYVNRALANAGRHERVDHRSYKDRGINLTPQPKRGRTDPKALFEDRRDRTLDLWDEWQRVARDNGDTIAHCPYEALAALTSNQSTFTRRELLRFLNGKTADAEQFSACLHAVLQHADLVSLGKDEEFEEHFTTRQTLVQEASLLEAGRKLAASKRHPVRARYARKASKQKTLTPDQDRVLEHITRKTGDIAIVSGYAGTGKSWMLGAARLAWEGEGYVVVGAALAGKAAEGLQDSSGIDSRTLARWELAWSHDKDRLTAKHVMVIDEAGMVGTAQLGRVLAHARDVGAKVVIVGDAEQLQPIDAGAPMRVLRDELDVEAVLSDIQRQEVAWQREATVGFPQDRPKESLHAYHAHGDIREHRAHVDARAAVVAAWERDQRERPNIRVTKKGVSHERPATSILLSYRRKDVQALNESVRAIRREAGALGADHKVSVRDREGAVHERPFAQGDRIYFLANDTPMDVMNGTLGTVRAISGPNMTVVLDNARELTFDTTVYDQFDHGYAATVHKAQGVTVDRAYVLASSPFDSGATYVAMTRHRLSVEMHWAHDEFGPRWANPEVSLPDFHGTISLHDDQEVAQNAALEQWQTSWRTSAVPALLVATSSEAARVLNLEARQLAELDGRLGADFWVRTLAGARAFAVGDRVQISNAIDELDLRQGVLGTLTERRAEAVTLRMDDGRTVVLDTTIHRGLDHGYAVSLEQSRAVQVERSIAFSVERLDDLAKERLSAPNLGRVTFHALEAPQPTVESFFDSICRDATKRHALEVQTELQTASVFAATPDHRAAFVQTPPERKTQYLADLAALAERPSLSPHEALMALPEVQEAYWTVQKAESALQEQLAHRASFQEQAGVAKRVGEFVTDKRAHAVLYAEKDLLSARQRFDDLVSDPSLRTRAEHDAATHNRKLGQAHDLHRALSEELTRAEREQRLSQRIDQLNELRVSQHRSVAPTRLAAATDHGRDLTFMALQTLGQEKAVICRDTNGELVAFDAARFRSDLAAIEKGRAIAISPTFEITVTPTHHTGMEMEHDLE